MRALAHIVAEFTFWAGVLLLFIGAGNLFFADAMVGLPLVLIGGATVFVTSQKP